MGMELFTAQDCNVRDGVLTIPHGVQHICARACSGNSCRSAIISDSVKTIGPYAFSRCENLTSIFIPASVESIDPGAFLGCESLSLVIFASASTLRYTDPDVFYGCSEKLKIMVRDSDSPKFCDMGFKIGIDENGNPICVSPEFTGKEPYLCNKDNKYLGPKPVHR